MSRYLFVHPEGNINNNPCLSGMVEILCDRGHEVRILSARRPGLVQEPPCARAELCLFDSENINGAFFLDRLSDAERTDIGTIRQIAGDADIAVGVDRGIIEAACVARVL